MIYHVKLMTLVPVIRRLKKTTLLICDSTIIAKTVLKVLRYGIDKTGVILPY